MKSSVKRHLLKFSDPALCAIICMYIYTHTHVHVSASYHHLHNNISPLLHKKQVLLNSYCSCHRTGSPLEEFLPLWQRTPRWHFLSAPPRPSSSSSLAPLLLDKQKTIICAVKKLVHVIVMKSFSEWCFYLIISPPVFIRMSSLIEAKLHLTITWLLINYYYQ